MIVMEQEPTPADKHAAYLAVCDMRLSTTQKCRVLNEAISWHKDSWRVVGITPAALEVFAKNNFKKVAKMGIHRAHLVDRSETYKHMLNSPMYNCDEWWDFYCKNDRTVFSTVSENMGDVDEESIIWFDAEGLFLMQGFAWRHTKQESSFLKKLYREVKKQEFESTKEETLQFLEKAIKEIL